MKYLMTLSLLALMAVSGNARAQQYKIPVENTKEGRLTLDEFIGDLTIEGYSGNEILITGSSEHFETPERAKGLKPIYPGGTDNTGLALSMEKDGNKITLRCLLSMTQSGRYSIKVPDNLSLHISRNCSRWGGTTVENMKSEIEFNGCHEIKLKSVTGPLVVSTIDGNIDVVFSEISKDKPISLASVSGEVDVTIPAKAAVNLEMSNVSGNMYTDFEFPASNKEMKRVGGSNIHNELNGGGTELKIHNISGNIYLRKG